RGGGRGHVAHHPRSAGGVRVARLHGVLDVARPGDRRAAVHARRHHRQGQAGGTGVDGRDPARPLAGGSLPGEGGGGRRGGAEAALARGTTGVNWQHFKAILGLRWRLTVNQARRSGVANLVVLIILMVLGVLVSLVMFGAMLLVGLLALDEAEPGVLMLVWD